MPVKLAISGRSPISVSDDHISIGSDSCCSIVVSDAPELKPIHAVIKEISGRWLVEACDTELLKVGTSEPGRRHWLKPGDVIHLTNNGVTITFQPPEDDDDFLPFVPRFADPSSNPTNVGGAATLKEEIPLTDTVDMVLPTTSVSIPTTAAPPSSGTIPTTTVPLSGTIPTSKANSPAATKAKRAASGTIKTVNDLAETPKKSSQSDGEIPARRPKKSVGAAASSARKSADDEIDLDLPVLTRTSSWEEEDFEPAPRRRRSNDKAEMEWILNVVGRCVAGGIAILIVWFGVSSLWKSLSQPSSGLPEAASTGIDGSAATANTVITPPPAPIAQRPIVKPVVSGTTETKVVSSEPNPTEATVKPVDETESAETDSAEMKSAEMKSAEMKSAEMKSGDGSEAIGDPSGDVKTVETADPPLNNGSSPTEQISLSPVLQATIESLYAVVMQDPAGTKQIHLGTAWAISDRHLVTSGTIATRMKALQKQGYTATAIQPSIDWAIRISDVRIHGKYTSGTADIATAVKTQNEKLLAQGLVFQLRYNLAVLDLDPAHQLEKQLPVVVKALRTTTETVYSMVGFPVGKPGDETQTMANVGALQECRSKRLSPTGAARLKEPVLNIKFSTQVIERNWSGSPVLNKDNEVIGIYAEIPAPSDKLPAKKDRQEQVVVWLGLLSDFAADVLKKTSPMDDDI